MTPTAAFVQMFSDVVMEMNKSDFEKIIDEMKEAKGVTQDVELDADDMKALVAKFKALYKEKMGADFPTDPKTQLIEAVKAVFRSWDNPRANVYRRMNEIPYDWGTAVNVQCHGVRQLRRQLRHRRGVHPQPRHRREGPVRRIPHQRPGRGRGGRHPYALPHHQAERGDARGLRRSSSTIAHRLENHYRDMQDMEFTIEDGKLYMLQTRNGKRTAAAALKIAVDLVDEGMIDRKGSRAARGAQAAGQPAASAV